MLANLAENEFAFFYHKVDGFVEDIVKLSDEFAKFSVEAFFETVESIERVIFREVSRNSAEVVYSASELDCPLNHIPLEQVVRHKVPVLV